jgi:hypothetical protein
MQASSKSKLGKKFFLRDEAGIFAVHRSFFDNEVKTRSDALVIALRVLSEIHYTLQEEARLGGPLYIGNMKVITGLQRSLSELDLRWPFLLVEMRAIPRRIGGYVLQTC